LLIGTLVTVLDSARSFSDVLTPRRVGIAVAGCALVASVGVAAL
jgi:hypothetical protein